VTATVPLDIADSAPLDCESVSLDCESVPPDTGESVPYDDTCVGTLRTGFVCPVTVAALVARVGGIVVVTVVWVVWVVRAQVVE
jgi:hypothetical protein